MESLRRTEVQLSMAEYNDERTRWVDEFGSDRLKLAKKLGLLKESDNVYREERRNREKKDWLLPNEMPASFRTVPIHNPSLEALRALELELETDPEATLMWVQWNEEITSTTHWGEKKKLSRGREALSTTFIGFTVYRWVSKG